MTLPAAVTQLLAARFHGVKEVRSSSFLCSTVVVSQAYLA